MCNLYSVGKNPNRDRKSWDTLVREAISSLPKIYALRPTDPGLVLLPAQTPAGIEPKVMRWGFARPGTRPLTNARGEKMEGGMWKDAFQHRRCLVVANCFYEFSGPAGAKQAHAFHRPDSSWFWMAGLWEESRTHGLCYTMVTTAPDALMEPVHDRRPAVLNDAEAEAYLRGDLPAAQVREPLGEGLLTSYPCENPLRMLNPGEPQEIAERPVQGELF